MINNEQIRDIIQNKNFVMFVTSLIFMSGILAYFCANPILFAAIFTCLMIVILYLRLFDIRRVIILTLIFYFGFFLTFCKIKTSDDLLSLTPTEITLQGRVDSIPAISGDKRVKFFMQVEQADDAFVHARTFVSATINSDIAEELNIGEKISVSGKLRKPFTSTNPSQFDYSAYLKNYNVFTTMYTSTSEIASLNYESSFKWKFLQGLNNLRKRIINTHSKYLKTPNIEILGGIVFGDDAVSTPDYIKNSFINSGLLHILAASGMNVAFIYTFWFFILRFLGVPFKPRVISGMFVVILYTLMTGLGPSVIRAALMLLFVLIGKLIDRDAHSVSLLSFVAVLMLIYNPAYINDVSFQLSFLVTFGLLTTANIVAQKLDFIPNWIKVPVLIPIVAQIWIAPIQMFYFNTFSLYSVLANIATVSLLSVISFCGFVSSVISIIPQFADFTCRVFDFFLNYFLNILVCISDFFAGLKYSLLQTTHPNVFQLIFYYLMLIIVTYLIKLECYKKAIVVLLSMALFLFVTTINLPSKNLEIIAFDVQNADSFLIKTPNNKYFMIDTGKSPYDTGNSQAKIIMLKYLKDRGIKNLDGLIVTHFDNDHSGGTSDIISNLNVKTLYLNSTKAETQTSVNIFKTAKAVKQNIKIVNCFEEIYSESQLSIKLNKANLNTDDSNENSIITLVSYKNFDMLFMGDAGVDAFNDIKNMIPSSVEVLKVGHHGARGVVDKNMITYLNNDVSLISTGVNYFGHPNKGTLDLLRDTEILRTDMLNSIKISTDGMVYKIFAYNSGKKKYEFRDEFLSNK